MSFSDMDRLEANYTKSSVSGIDQKSIKKDRIWKLQYAEPKDDNERLMIARVIVREGGISSLWNVLGIFMTIVSIVYLGIHEVEWPSIIIFSLAIFVIFKTFSIISKKRLKQHAMYDEYNTNRNVYLVKFGKTNVYAIYE